MLFSPIVVVPAADCELLLKLRQKSRSNVAFNDGRVANILCILSFMTATVTGLALLTGQANFALFFGSAMLASIMIAHVTACINGSPLLAFVRSAKSNKELKHEFGAIKLVILYLFLEA